MMDKKWKMILGLAVGGVFGYTAWMAWKKYQSMKAAEGPPVVKQATVKVPIKPVIK
jgi:uncharacterized membrane protein YebE (DUF533 family)